MSVREFSERSGVSQPSVYAYANGERVPDVTRLRAIRATLGCTWDELLGD
jgi:transcriptional regulator with XRE-family HTH domain